MYIALVVLNLCVCSGSYSTFEGMRGQIEAKKQKDYQLQQKTLKEFKSQGKLCLWHPVI